MHASDLAVQIVDLVKRHVSADGATFWAEEEQVGSGYGSQHILVTAVTSDGAAYDFRVEVHSLNPSATVR